MIFIYKNNSSNTINIRGVEFTAGAQKQDWKPIEEFSDAVNDGTLTLLIAATNDGTPVAFDKVSNHLEVQNNPSNSNYSMISSIKYSLDEIHEYKTIIPSVMEAIANDKLSVSLESGAADEDADEVAILIENKAFYDFVPLPTDNPPPITYTVHFDLNGGTSSRPDDQIVNAGAKATDPGSPTLENYSFLGWLESSEGIDYWDFDADVVLGNIILSARWEAIG